LCLAVFIDWRNVVASGIAGLKRNALPGLGLQAFALALALT
jgi:hypothetical protein